MEMASLNVLCQWLNVQVPDSDSVPANAPPPPPSNKAFLKEKLNAAIVIVIVVKTYKIQGRKPGGKVKQQSGVECLTKIQDSE